MDTYAQQIVNHYMRAYREGYFPMADDSGEIHWFCPFWRCLFPIEGMHVSRSLKRTLSRARYTVTFDVCFEEVMRSCVRPQDNWITEELIQHFTVLHRAGIAHSCEVWEGGELVGGVYGIAVGAVFCAESKFHRRTDASKVGLYYLIEHVRALGFEILDAQFINDHTKSLGAFEITQTAYVAELKRLRDVKIAWQCDLQGS